MRTTKYQNRKAKATLRAHQSHVRTLWINDKYSPLKTHVFKLYADGHIAYNQAINGVLFYRSFQRANKRHGYYGYLADYRRTIFA